MSEHVHLYLSWPDVNTWQSWHRYVESAFKPGTCRECQQPEDWDEHPKEQAMADYTCPKCRTYTTTSKTQIVIHVVTCKG